MKKWAETTDCYLLKGGIISTASYFQEQRRPEIKTKNNKMYLEWKGKCSAPYFDSGIFITQIYYTVFTYYMWTQLYFINYILACYMWLFTDVMMLSGLCSNYDIMMLSCLYLCFDYDVTTINMPM